MPSDKIDHLQDEGASHAETSSPSLTHKLFVYSLFSIILFTPILYVLYTVIPEKVIRFWFILPLAKVQLPARLLPSIRPGFSVGLWLSTMVSKLVTALLAVCYYISGLFVTLGLAGLVSGITATHLAGGLRSSLSQIHNHRGFRLLLKLYGMIICALLSWIVIFN